MEFRGRAQDLQDELLAVIVLHVAEQHRRLVELVLSLLVPSLRGRRVLLERRLPLHGGEGLLGQLRRLGLPLALVPEAQRGDAEEVGFLGVQ